MNMAHFFRTAWTFSPTVLLSSAFLMSWYVGAFRLERRAGWFFGGVILLPLTLLSPLNTLADGYLFSAHMAQHILLLLIVPAMLLLGLPTVPRLRWRGLRNPVTGWLAGVGAMWFWHIPAMCNAAVESAAIHALQTVSLLLLGGLFWLRILTPDEAERLSPPVGVAYLGSACITCSVLGIIITLSPVAVCSIYTMPPPSHAALLRILRADWGLTPERDQQIGGLLMWVPMCLLYLWGICGQIARWFAEPVAQPQK